MSIVVYAGKIITVRKSIMGCWVMEVEGSHCKRGPFSTKRAAIKEGKSTIDYLQSFSLKVSSSQVSPRKPKQTEDTMTKQESKSLVESLDSLLHNLQDIKARIEKLEKGQAILAKKTPLVSPTTLTLEEEITEKPSAAKVSKPRQVVAKEIVKSVPVTQRTKRRLSPEAMEKLTAAREAWFKKKGYGKYALPPQVKA